MPRVTAIDKKYLFNKLSRVKEELEGIIWAKNTPEKTMSDQGYNWTDDDTRLVRDGIIKLKPESEWRNILLSNKYHYITDFLIENSIEEYNNSIKDSNMTINRNRNEYRQRLRKETDDISEHILKGVSDKASDPVSGLLVEIAELERRWQNGTGA